jgi:hypothetical protein
LATQSRCHSVGTTDRPHAVCRVFRTIAVGRSGMRFVKGPSVTRHPSSREDQQRDQPSGLRRYPLRHVVPSRRQLWFLIDVIHVEARPVAAQQPTTSMVQLPCRRNRSANQPIRLQLGRSDLGHRYSKRSGTDRNLPIIGDVVITTRDFAHHGRLVKTIRGCSSFFPQHPIQAARRKGMVRKESIGSVPARWAMLGLSSENSGSDRPACAPSPDPAGTALHRWSETPRRASRSLFLA